MALRKIKVMISSRCNDRFPAGGPTLSETRQRLKTEIEATEVWGEALFEVWINEIAPPDEGTQDSWDTCLEKVRDCDILIALSNGNAGWAARAGDIGICHAELMTALNAEGAKVRLISLGDVAVDSTDQGQRNARFQAYVATQSLFRGGGAATPDALTARVKEAVLHATTNLVGLGVREARRGRYHTGEALAWSKLDFVHRQERICETLVDGFADDGATREGPGLLTMSLSGESVLLSVHAIPASLAVSAAREMIGRPFLRDHELDGVCGAAVGPLHVIGCHQGASETQARQLLGFPDATFVTAPFGIYAADEVQAVQFIFLQNCRDETTTRHALQRFLEWLQQSGEVDALVARAKSRRQIIATVARELSLRLA
ncbi:MAG: DUF4062 domain-containing protein [Caulobacterales bacterium]